MAYDFVSYKVAAPCATTANGVTMRVSYDAMGRILTRTDGFDDHVTRFKYDAVGRILKETHPDDVARVLEYAVDATQNTITTTDELGRKSRLKHNPFGNVIAAVLLDGASEILLRRCSYDAQNRLITETTYNGSGAAQNTARYTYDHLDRVTAKTVYPGTGSTGELAKTTTA
jgi:YD repeat-containing protein